MNLSDIQWEEPRPQADPSNPFFDVVPIPFYPDDLPDITPEPLTADQLLHASRLARRWLWVAPPTNKDLAA